MLTIKSPIQLKCQVPMETLHKDFNQRIIGNYTILNSRLRKEELLYITTQTPEVYFAEGNNISILNDVNVQNNQEIKLDMINNLINRILVSKTDNLKYQDIVYISSTLRKLGITDVANFMKQVYKFQEETKENIRLINQYEQQKKIILNSIAQGDKILNLKESNIEEQKVYNFPYYLHEEIYERLDTGSIYEEIYKFSQGLEHNTKRVDSTEVALSEQVSIANNLNLNQLKKEVYDINEPINYYHANTYEMADEEENVSEEEQKAEISSAILLNLLDGIYSVRVKQIENNNHNWYMLASSLFQSAENTWKRYETYHREGKKTYKSIYENVTENAGASDINTYQTYLSSDYVQHQESLKMEFLEEFGEEVVGPRETEKVTEYTKEQLDEINRRNIENLKKIQEIEQSRPQVRNVEINRERAQKDALKALESPQEVVMEYLKSDAGSAGENINSQIDAAVYNLFTEETKAIFNQYVQQKKGEMTLPVMPSDTEKKQAQENLKLQHFMQQAELENSRVHTPSRHVTDRKQNVDFVHKVEEQIITEELINTIRSQSIDNHREETIERNVMNISTTERQINEAVNNIRVTKQENIEELVQLNVKKQLNQISDQVYGKIEKKLQTERKRRGY